MRQSLSIRRKTKIHVNFRMDKIDNDELKKICKKEDISITSLMNAIIKAFLYEYKG